MKSGKRLLVVFFSFLIIVATVAFNFSEFTGQANRLAVFNNAMERVSRGEGSIKVFPKEISSGEKLFIEIKPGDRCIENHFTVYKKGVGSTVQRFSDPAYSFKFCKDTIVSYKTWNDWDEGEYYLEMKELPYKTYGKIDARTKYLTDDFTIRNFNEVSLFTSSSDGEFSLIDLEPNNRPVSPFLS